MPGPKRLLMSVCVLLSFDCHAGEYAWPVTRVVDGDTLAVDASADFPPELADIKVRILGVDTPEKGGRAKCEQERTAGQEATAYTAALVEGASRVVFRDPAWGKWGGRVLANVYIDGRSLSELLIERGHGRPYDGGKRQPWCE